MAAAPSLNEETFAAPPATVRPMYRWWLPLAYTDDDVLREQLRDLAASGAGGVEVAPFVVAGAGNQSNAFLAEYGWGTPAWAHKMEVITEEAAQLGLRVDQNLGPHYPPTVPSLNSFNQPEAEQQLVFGWEVHQPGDTRSGALPDPVTAPPSVSTPLAEASSLGDNTLRVEDLGGFAVGDVITVGDGERAEDVTVEGVGDRTEEIGTLSVSPLTTSHEAGASVENIARTTRLRTLVAQCDAACADGGDGPVALVADSVIDVTADVTAGALDHTFAEGNGNPWVVVDFLQTASGLIAQRGGYTVTQPNYVVDHLGRGGVDIQAEYWDEHILTDAVKANLDRIGGGALFEDSLELGEAQKWTWDFLYEFEERRGYDATTFLPALAGIGIQGTDEGRFELAGVGDKVREDYRQTVSDLFIDEYVTPMQEWAEGHGLDFRLQAYGLPTSTAYASSAAGVPEGESLNFGSPNPLGAEQNYRVVSGGAHLAGRDVVSVECCAVFFGGYRSSAAGPNIGGQYTDDGGGSQIGGQYSQGLLDSVYKSYAGGVNQVVWHGLAYPDAPAGAGSEGRDGGTWPGYQPWDIFGVLNVNDAFGPRQPSWEDYAEINESLARTQLVLREGKAKLDLGVYYEDLGLSGSSVSPQQSPQHMLGTDSATSAAGYTYEYVAPEFLHEEGLEPEVDGGLFGDRSDYQALVLNDQRTIALSGAERLLDLAGQGLRVFIVGEAPSETTGADPEGGKLAGVVDALLAQPTVTSVPTEAELPQVLAEDGILPAVAPDGSAAALGLVRRVDGEVTYDFVYNRSEAVVEQDLTLTGSGRPYRLNTWTGEIAPLGEYVDNGTSVTVPVRVAPYDQVVIALAPEGVFTAPASGTAVHALDSDGDVYADERGSLLLRVWEDGRHMTILSDGSEQVTDVTGLAAEQPLERWILRAQSWGPAADAMGANASATAKTDLAEVVLTADEDGNIPSWREITEPVDLSRASGLGTYSTTLELPSNWQDSDGAYLDLGDVLDTVRVTVNGEAVVVNQADCGRIDLGHHLNPGTNTLTVRVATTLFNAVRSTGDSNYQMPDWQRTGLMGPVVLTPYRDTVLVDAIEPGTPGPTEPGTPGPTEPGTPPTGGDGVPGADEPGSGGLAATGSDVLPFLLSVLLLVGAGTAASLLKRHASR